MKQARHLTLERQVDPTAEQSQEHLAAERRATSAPQLSQPLLVVSLCSRLSRAIAAHDPIGAGHTRGALVRLALRSRERLTRAPSAYPPMITLGADA